MTHNQPATMSVDCPTCKAQAGHECKARGRGTHQARIERYRRVSMANRFVNRRKVAR